MTSETIPVREGLDAPGDMSRPTGGGVTIRGYKMYTAALSG